MVVTKNMNEIFFVANALPNFLLLGKHICLTRGHKILAQDKATSKGSNKVK